MRYHFSGWESPEAPTRNKSAACPWAERTSLRGGNTLVRNPKTPHNFGHDPKDPPRRALLVRGRSLFVLPLRYFSAWHASGYVRGNEPTESCPRPQPIMEEALASNLARDAHAILHITRTTSTSRAARTTHPSC